ncbi:hypothetical protein ES332_D05G089000v1 [Gossypium tomentosum]|uniref:Uncharacterized protein n=1 Tax=Gossypium tomentosum TaxID=34277 RepID=A0A5D2KVV7_GOSTO|nr:hypothetical protein ES332_D05G089000v1 [Gossypium tomentosum]
MDEFGWRWKHDPIYFPFLAMVYHYVPITRLLHYRPIPAFGSLFLIPRRISYSPITLTARNRHYAPSAPITHSASFSFFFSVFCPRPQHSRFSHASLHIGCFSFVSRPSSSSLRIDFICQVQSPNYNATLKQIFPNIQQIDSEVLA